MAFMKEAALPMKLSTPSAQSALYSSMVFTRAGQAMASALGGMTVQMDAQAVGMLVAPTVSRELGRQVKSRQYTT